MNILGFNIERKARTLTLDQLIRRLEAVHDTVSGISVTPDTAMESPTVHGIVMAISRRISTLPVHVMRNVESAGRTRKERVPSHPVERLLNRPNDWQTRTSYWLDAASNLVRWGNHYCHKGRGSTGPIRALTPLQPGNVEVEQLDDWTVRYNVTQPHGGRETYSIGQMHHARGPARNGFSGDSPVMDMREAIALEIAAERFGASLFGNGAMPGIVMKYAAGFQGHRNEEDRKGFIESFQAAFTGKRRHRAWLMPAGAELDKTIDIANDKAQFLETRKYQRTVIAGGMGVPPHYVGDLENGTLNNVEQQNLGFVVDVVLPYVRIFEAALERDLLTDEDRRAGIIIRFNVDGALRGDFKSRQEGLNIMRQAGVVSANDWREHENMNPISTDDGGDEYWRQGPSGQSAGAPTEEGDDE